MLWERYCDDAREAGKTAYSYSRYCERLAPQLPGSSSQASMRFTYAPGECLFTDFAGRTLRLADGTAVEIFVGILAWSRYTYAEAVPSQMAEHWCLAHSRMFTKLGGVTTRLIFDNLKSAVIRNDGRGEVVLAEPFDSLCKHNGVAGPPTRRSAPKQKALVENGVLLAERRVLAPLRNHVFHDLASLNRAIAAQVRRVNQKPYADGTGETRFSRFESVDVPHMKPLPDQRWQRTVWRGNKVHPDYHIAIDYHFYSVPYTYVGKEVDVRLRGRVIDVFYRGKQIASHLSSDARGRATTLKGHRPQAHQRADVENTRTRLENRARDIGPHVHAFVITIMERNHNPEFGFRSCYGVLRLAKSHGPDRLDNACRYALDLGIRTWRGLDNILRTGTDLVDEPEPETAPINHSNIRGPEYYR
ncbi:MAG: IS21 family transposase [Paracoccaceae bacterium]|nr:IS21 family transposase [Paracoccaceae bacterium]